MAEEVLDHEKSQEARIIKKSIANNKKTLRGAAPTANAHDL